MIAVLVALTSIVLVGVVFSVGFLSGTTYVVKKQNKAIARAEQAEKDKIAWMVENSKTPLTPPRTPWQR